MFFSRATLNETFTAKYDGVLPRTPLVRPKSEIYPPKRDDEHPHPFHMWSPPPRNLTSLKMLKLAPRVHISFFQIVN